MSWMQSLYETFENCVDTELASIGDHPLVPVGHMAKQAHIEVAIDAEGSFLRARVIDRERTIIPVTESSSIRTGNGEPHPLAEKLHFCGGDYSLYGGRKKSFFKEYLSLIRAWAVSNPSHPKVRAIHSYVSKGSLVADLLACKVLWLAPGTSVLATDWVGDSLPDIFKSLVVKDKQDQGDAFVRWVVEVPGEPNSATWNDPSIVESWQRFLVSTDSKRALCYVSGTVGPVSEKHPRFLRHSADGAKLISSNDEIGSGFVFYGKFLEPSQSCAVSFDVSQKAHNALRWLIARQGFKNSTQVVVTWAVTGQKVPVWWQRSTDVFGLDNDQSNSVENDKELFGDLGQTYARKLNKAILGFKAPLNPSEQIVVLGLDSASPGRMAIVYYRELLASEFLSRIECWHLNLAWHFRSAIAVEKGAKKKGCNWIVTTPSLKDIVEVAYGQNVDDKLSRATIERLLPIVIDGRSIPIDLVESVVRRASAFPSYKEAWEWERAVSVACALYRGYFSTISDKNKRREYSMTLELERRTRDYLYGRLLAIADHVESRALYYAGEERDTNAMRLMQRFADRPKSTWRIIELGLVPYKARIKARSSGLLFKLDGIIDEVFSLFDHEDFISDRPLSGEYLLGFHCQRFALRAARSVEASEAEGQ